MTVRVWSSVEFNSTGRKLKQIIDRFPGNHGDYYITSSHRSHTPGSHHGGRLSYGGSPTSAIDIGFNYGSSGDSVRARNLAQWLYQYSGDTVELISTIGGGGFYVKNGSRVGGYAVSTHRDHIHFATSSALADQLLSRIPDPTPQPSPAPQRDDLDMADLLWMISSDSQKLENGEMTAVRWQRGSYDGLANASYYKSILFPNKRMTGHVVGRVVAFDEDGNFKTPVFRAQMGKVDASSGAGPNPLFEGAIFLTSEFALPLDAINGDEHKLRLYITSLVPGVEWRSGKISAWYW